LGHYREGQREVASLRFPHDLVASLETMYLVSPRGEAARAEEKRDG
jgi:hypothetical protein